MLSRSMRHGSALAFVMPVVLLTTTEVSAQEARAEIDVEPFDAPPPGTILAPDNAFELQFNLGYAQPFGELTEDVEVNDLAGPGFLGGGAIAWRLTPRYAVVGYGGWGHWVGDDRLDDGKVFGGAGGVAASFHFQPHERVDPVLQLGAGYRLLFVAPGDERDNHMFHGFQALKVELAVDIRVNEDFAIGPVFSGDVNVLPWDLNTSTGDNGSLDDPGINTFLFVGVAGRHDVLGRRVHERVEPVTAKRTASY